MIRMTSLMWLTGLTAYVLLWQECGENPVVFCYRIVWDTLKTVPYRALVPVYVSPRINPACSRTYGTFSRPFTMSKD
jgi:hypothetical protein